MMPFAQEQLQQQETDDDSDKCLTIEVVYYRM